MTKKVSKVNVSIQKKELIDNYINMLILHRYNKNNSF